MTQIFIAMMIVTGSPQHSFAEDTPTCDVVLRSCDRALQAQVEVNNIQRQINQDQEKRFAVQETQLAEAREENNKWYRNPLTLTFIGLNVGVLGTLLIVGAFHK